jgi:hypothetical protein
MAHALEDGLTLSKGQLSRLWLFITAYNFFNFCIPAVPGSGDGFFSKKPNETRLGGEHKGATCLFTSGVQRNKCAWLPARARRRPPPVQRERVRPSALLAFHGGPADQAQSRVPARPRGRAVLLWPVAPDEASPHAARAPANYRLRAPQQDDVLQAPQGLGQGAGRALAGRGRRRCFRLGKTPRGSGVHPARGGGLCRPWPPPGRGRGLAPHTDAPDFAPRAVRACVRLSPTHTLTHSPSFSLSLSFGCRARTPGRR